MPEPKEWKLKTNEDGAPAVDGTKVVFIDPEGRELPLDPPSMYQKIIDLGKEAKTHREAAKSAEKVLSLFEGVEDVADYKQRADEALETVQNFNDKDWMKADKVENLKKEMSNSYEEKLDSQKRSFENALVEKDGVISSKDTQIHKLLVSNNFQSHPLFGGSNPKSKLTPEIAEAYFSKHFRVEVGDDGIELLLRAYKDPGVFKDPIYSREDPGEPANFTEAMNELWGRFPGRDQLMAAGPSGSGSGSNAGGEDDAGDDELASLKKAHAKAKEEGRVKDAIALKNRIFRLEKKLKESGRA